MTISSAISFPPERGPAVDAERQEANQSIILIFFLLACALITSCTSRPDIPSLQASSTVTLTQPVPPTATASPTIKPRPSASPTQTPRPTHTQTPTSVPVGDWHMPVVDLNWANSGYYFIGGWIDDASVILENEESGMVVLDAYTGEVESVITPTPTVDYEALLQTQLSEPSRTDDFEITCSKNGLEMVRLPGQEMVSQSGLPVESCYYQVTWARDGSAASVVTDQGDVFVWRSDGTQPYWVGEVLGSSAVWSPDNSKLLVLDDNGEEASFSILYLDGRPQSAAKAIIEVGNQWGEENLDWLTNNIVWNFRGCVIPNYCFQDFYHAESGKFLMRNEITDGGGQDALLSPDQQWLAMEVLPYADNWDERYTYDADTEKRLILYDLKVHKQHVWAKSKPIRSLNGGLSFEFIGWSNDSRQFYFVYYPFGNLSAELPFGFMALDRQSLKTQVLIPNVIFTCLSPDGQSIFIVTADRIESQMAYGIQGAIYTLDGKPITEVQPIAAQLEFEALNQTDFYGFHSDPIPARWNEASTQVVFAGPDGDLWLMDTNGETRQIVSGLPVEQYWQEEVLFDWSPNGQFLLVWWGELGWIVQVHD